VQTTHVSVVGKHYDVLAESDKAEAMVIEHKNSVACMFRIDKNYQESTLLLQNFLLHFLD
jgi:hypothetical protein